MFNQSHDIGQEFPEYREQIHQLKMKDRHFMRLWEEYHDIDRQLLRIEQELETPSDLVVETLKKKRLQLKDEILGYLRKAA